MQVLCPHSVKTSAKWFLIQRSNLTYTVVIALIHSSPLSSPSMQPYRGKAEFYPGPVPQPGSIPQPELLLSILNPYAWEGERGWGHYWGNQVCLVPTASGKKFLPVRNNLFWTCKQGIPGRHNCLFLLSTNVSHLFRTGSVTFAVLSENVSIIDDRNMIAQVVLDILNGKVISLCMWPDILDIS